MEKNEKKVKDGTGSRTATMVSEKIVDPGDRGTGAQERVLIIKFGTGPVKAPLLDSIKNSASRQELAHRKARAAHDHKKPSNYRMEIGECSIRG